MKLLNFADDSYQLEGEIPRDCPEEEAIHIFYYGGGDSETTNS